MREASYDIVVIGGGPGGYVAAIRARQLGLTTALVERAHLGGICLNWGCIPTKALLRTAEIRHLLDHLEDFGLSAEGVRFDLDRVVRRSRQVAEKLAAGVRHLMKKNGVEVFEGHGRLAGLGSVEVATEGESVARLSAPHVILATGARPRTIPGLEPDGKLVWTYKEAMVPDRLPRSLLVVGSGAIGIEFASFYRNMGAEVVVVEVLPRILPLEDEEISALAHKQFEAQGMKLHAGAQVETLERGADEVTAVLRLGGGAVSPLSAERVIVAAGIVGNTESLGLEGTGVRIEGGHVIVDEWLQTGESGVYAIGDLAGPPWLAHKASHEGVICVERIAGLRGVQPLAKNRIPACTYCRPQIASIGLTEAAAREAGHEVRVGRFPARANGKAVALGEVDGLVKTVFDAKTDELLGAHMIGPEVTEMIQGYAVAMTLETTEAEIVQSVFPHPTVSEMMHEAVLDAYGRALNM